MSLTLLQCAGVVLAGMAAGAINTVLGSGSLITFPTLLALGYPPVIANVSNNIGLVPGTMSGVFGYRRELSGQGRRARTLAVGSILGALLGAVLLLRLPSDVFDALVPVLILVACALLAFQPSLSSWVAGRRQAGARDVGALPFVLTFGAGIYGGYFGAAQGVILVGLLGVLVPDSLERTNALKNVLAGAVNISAAVLFAFFADVAWEAVLLLGVGSTVGAALGARFGRRVPARVLRPAFVIFGVGVAVYLLVR